MPCIYKITNIITQDFYIGKTIKTSEERFLRHIYLSRYDSQTHLHRAMRKYGEHNFIIETLETPSESILSEREKILIEEHKPPYNMTEGGDGGYTAHSPNFIESMKKYHSKKDRSSYATYGMLGKKFPESSKKLISEKNSCPVVCEGITYPSVAEAEKAYPGIKVRGRLDNPKYPDFYRLRERTKRK
jgi:group I intron endonuclease